VSAPKRKRYRIVRLSVGGWVSSTEKDQGIVLAADTAWLLTPVRKGRGPSSLLLVDRSLDGDACLVVTRQVAAFDHGRLVECEPPARAKDGTWRMLADAQVQRLLLYFSLDLSRDWLN
jgi:hypothetical protein